MGPACSLKLGDNGDTLPYTPGPQGRGVLVAYTCTRTGVMREG